MHTIVDETCGVSKRKETDPSKTQRPSGGQKHSATGRSCGAVIPPARALVLPRQRTELQRLEQLPAVVGPPADWERVRQFDTSPLLFPLLTPL